MEYNRLAYSNELQGWKIISTFEENGKMYANCKRECSRCGGKGIIQYYGHVDGGVCFKCSGNPYEYKTMRVYTDAERAAQDQRREKKERDRLEAARASAADDKAAWFKAHGLDSSGAMFFPAGCNTYEIKDYLKEKGANYSDFGWYFGVNNLPDDLELPEGGFLYMASFDSCFDWNINWKRPCIKSGALDEMKANIREITRTNNEETSTSRHYGTIGDRIKKAPAKFISKKSYSNDWGGGYIYTFEMGGNIFTWFTQAEVDAEVGDDIILSGTIKNHTEFNGVQQTQLNRCIIKKA